MTVDDYYLKGLPSLPRRSSVSSLASLTNFHVRTGLSSSVQLARPDRRRLAVLETHLEKHSSAEHGERMCQQCQQILARDWTTSDRVTSPPSSSSSSYTSCSSSTSCSSCSSRRSRRYRSLSYTADRESTPPAREDFNFTFEDHAVPAVVAPVLLADIEYRTNRSSHLGIHKQNNACLSIPGDLSRRERERKLARFSNRVSRSQSPRGKGKHCKTPKVHRPCVHNLAKKHRSCNVCYECKQCKEMFLKKESRVEQRSRGEETGKCNSCDTIKVRPVKNFVDCYIE